MRWWAWVWVGTLLVLTAGGAWDDWEEARPAWYAVLSAAAGLWCATAAAGHFVRTIRATLGRMLLPGSILTIAWMTFTGFKELSALKSDPDLSPMASTVVLVVVVAVVLTLFGPALFHGIRDGCQAWRESSHPTSA
jgi:UDP-N-acetylmuramyl pentapeptide phosphotransferase/UDP-N-acetylglucosamine-1-phosphate transferase